MIEWLEEIDRALFLKLNGLHQPWLDQPMMIMTKAIYWIPVYIGMLYLIFKAYNWKTMLFSLLGVALVVTLGDRISVELFKEVFLRYRPSHNLDLDGLIYHVNGYRGGKYGFVSSHATNFFGIATFVFLLIRKQYLGWGIAILFWAALICYTRIYLGVHYPGDLFAGGLLGAVIGWFVFRLFRKFHLDKLPK